MSSYILKRLLLIFPTLFGIMVLNFIIVQFAPGGPVEQTLAKIQGLEGSSLERVSGVGSTEIQGSKDSQFKQHSITSGSSIKYRGAHGIEPEIIAEIEKMYGFDKPPFERFIGMIKNYLVFDFGSSFYRDETVVNLVIDKFPVSISLGLWTTLLVYLISIPLGIKKAVSDGSAFDIWTSTIIIIGYAIPGFLFAIMLVIVFAGGSFLDWFPLRGLVSNDWDSMGLFDKITDYFWHIALPITAMVISGFASLTMLCKNSFMDEIGKQYVMTARAKGASEHRVLYGHVFRNAMLIIIAGFPAAFLGILFTGSMLIELIFSLDGLGLLGYEAVLSRDYPIIFGTLYVYTIIGLLIGLLGDLMYMLIDPRINFDNMKV